jgi:hypothetical protein
VLAPGLRAPSDLRRTIAVFFYGLPKVDDNGDYVNVVLKHGGFEVNSVELNKITNAGQPIAFWGSITGAGKVSFT